ncbi:MAG: hypothetical protein H3Z52_02675 [archaeon]|nr:hypothetical protein [archaeon]MCP8319831.1 hypothetical protein [archaeon]
MEFTRSLSLLKDIKARPSGMGISALGIGSAGCRILSYLHRSSILIENFIYISCDEQDLSYSPLGEKILINSDICSPRSPSAIRGIAIGYIDQIRKVLADSKYVFIISGLGGNIGSGLSPFLAKVAKESKAIVISIVAMPFKFEKNKHFYAGVALRQIRKLSDAVIIIDNDSLLERVPKEPMLDVYALVNEKISTALNKLIETPQGKEVGVGLKKFIETINREGYAILSVYESFKATEEAVAEASRSVHQIAKPDQASNAILCIMSNGKVSTEDVSTSVSRIGSLFGNGSIEIQYGISMSNRQGLTAILLTSGFKDTKFSDYDPMAKILHRFELDEDLDTNLNVKLPKISHLEEF